MLSRISADGNADWSISYGTNATTVPFYPISFALNTNGDIYVTGSGREEGWKTLKYNSQGTELWSRTNRFDAQYQGWESSSSLIVLPGDKVAVCGTLGEGCAIIAEMA